MDRKELIEKARELLACGALSKEAADAIKGDFPELKESEDEKIRKGLVSHLKELRNWEVGTLSPIKTHEHYDAWLAYLEKQKEQKPVKLDDDTEVGLDRALQIVKDAKGNLCGYQSDDGIYECDHAIQTLERILKDGIEQKSAEWSEEDKDMIRDIIDALDSMDAMVLLSENDEEYYPEDHSKQVAWLKSLPERFNLPLKQEWSEEAEYCRNQLIVFCENCMQQNSEATRCANWLKSLRPQQKVEWTEDDEAHMKWLCRIVHSRRVHGELSLAEESELGKWMDKWLNHNPQPHWKPSEEQMEALADALSLAKNCGEESSFDLRTLYEQLKKL